MSELAPFVAALLLALIPALAKALRGTSADARPQPRLKERLRDRVRKSRLRQGSGGQAWFPCIALLAVLCTAGCTRTIYVPHGEPVRLRETVKDVKVWGHGSGREARGRQDEPARRLVRAPDGAGGVERGPGILTSWISLALLSTA